MARIPTVPDRSEYRAELSRLDRAARGRVLRAANLARPAGDPHEAGIAAAAAAAQRRFWRRWWIAGPIVAGLLQVREGMEVFLVNLAMATVMFGAMAMFFTWWAGRAEQVNRAVVEAAAASARKERKPGSGKPRSTRRKRKKKGKR